VTRRPPRGRTGPSRGNRARDGSRPSDLSGWLGTRFARDRWTVPLALFALSFLFRLPFMNQGLFHHDEVLLARAVEGTVARLQLVGEFNGRYGAVLLNALIYAPYRALSGLGSERVILSLSLVSGALLAAVLYLLVLELAGRRYPAALAALFFSFNYLFLTTSTTGKENTLQAFFAVLALWLVVRGAKRGSWRLKLLSFAAFAFSLTIHEVGITLAPIFVLLLVLHGWTRTPRVPAALRDIAGFAAFAAIPWFLYLGDVFRRTLVTRDTATAAFAGFFSPTLSLAVRDLVAACGLVALGLALAGVVALRRRPRVLVPVFLWASLILYYGNVTTYAPRYLIYVVMPVAILCGFGAAALLQWVRPAWGRWLAAATLVAAICGSGVARAYPLIDFRRGYCGPKQMARFVAAKTEPDAVVITMDESVFIEYYGRRRTLLHPVGDCGQQRAFVSRIRSMALSGRRLYVNSTAFTYDDSGCFTQAMLDSLQFKRIGDVLDEDYHRPELGSRRFTNQLLRILPGKEPPRTAS